MGMNPEKKQRILALVADDEGCYYYNGPLDGKWGTKSKEAEQRFLKDFASEAVPETDTTPTNNGNTVMVFSLAADGNKYVSEHFQVKEFACNDGSDVVLIHPLLPVWAEAARTINGAFKPNSAYRTVSYNASIKDASPKSTHCRGIAMDIPKKKATSQELYDLFVEIMGNAGGLGIYDWGIHVDCRAIKSRWDYRGK